MRISPEKDLSSILARIENPARYVGGEYGIIQKSASLLKIAVCFPDLYEIGMCNQAMAILYGMLNSLDNVSCERVFCPAGDFETELSNSSLPLYGLESGTPLNEFDIAAFTVGYELSATNILTMLDRGGVPLSPRDRGEGYPIVIAGGPAVTNPLPFGNIFDAVYIGEAEAGFRSLVEKLVSAKKSGAGRQDILDYIFSCESFWYAGRKTPAVRSVWNDFSGSPSYAVNSPVPSIRTVQDHGVVEIMRGCPHGCRFCHAGVFYKPFRMKKADIIYQEVYNLVHSRGYREITLSSLSSGDYTDIVSLVRNLNSLHSRDYVSFALPSLHLESFGIHLLSEISSVRKSGLTFAVETPGPEYQKSLNKPASFDKILSILNEASDAGWKTAKFYFMIGLPFDEEYDEVGEIMDFINAISRKTRFQLNVNIGTFIPKPHTPYQWASQLTEEQSLAKITQLRKNLSSGSVKIGYHSPFQSYLEGIVSRGDERAGDLILLAYKAGARFDAWEDRGRHDIWRSVIESADWDVEKATCSARDVKSVLPWESAVSLGVTGKYLRRERENHEKGIITEPCAPGCTHQCGACGSTAKPVIEFRLDKMVLSESLPPPGKRLIYRHICSFEKTGKAAYLPHLALMRVIERSFLRAGVIPRFTEGFNPKPVIEFSQPSPVGMDSLEDVFSFDSYEPETGEVFIPRVNSRLPQGLKLLDSMRIDFYEGEKKPPSLMSVFGGGRYEVIFPSSIYLHAFLGETASIESIAIVEQVDTRLVLDHTASPDAKGFIALVREKFVEGETKPKIRRLATYARCADGSPAAYTNAMETYIRK